MDPRGYQAPRSPQRVSPRKEGEKIPEAKLEKAEHSKNPKTAARARLAETLKGLHKKK